MHMYEYVHTCICMLCVNIWMCMRACIWMYMHEQKHVYVFICLHICIRVCTCMYMFVHVWTHVWLCVHVNVYMKAAATQHKTKQRHQHRRQIAVVGRPQLEHCPTDSSAQSKKTHSLTSGAPQLLLNSQQCVSQCASAHNGESETFGGIFEVASGRGWRFYQSPIQIINVTGKGVTEVGNRPREMQRSAASCRNLVYFYTYIYMFLQICS